MSGGTKFPRKLCPGGPKEILSGGTHLGGARFTTTTVLDKVLVFMEPSLPSSRLRL